jgi:hydroxypyruvate reductase
VSLSPGESAAAAVQNPQRLLRAMFDAALAAADPLVLMRPYLPEPPRGRTVVVGAGKASASMARAVEAAWPGELEGLIVTRYGYAVPCERIEIVEAAHPVPDSAGAEAARRIVDLVSGLGRDDLVIALISGGGSSLLALPADGVTLADKQQLTAALLRSGAPIEQVNLVRKHLSAIKGGRLATAAYPARVVGLLISDVPGDDPAVIASGPTVAETSSPADARAVLDRYGIDSPPSVTAYLSWSPSCPGKEDPRLALTHNTIVASPQLSLEAAAEVARQAGVATLILGDSLEGEARDLGVVLAGIAKQVRRHGQPIARPCVLLSGGETTVTVRGTGTGGRNVELLLSLAIALRSAPDVYALACDTDGVDGQAEVAGAWIGPDTLRQAREAGLSAQRALDDNDAHPFFAAVGNQVLTGPTYTNVNDFRAVLIC